MTLTYQKWKSRIYYLYNQNDLKKKLPRSRNFYLSLIEGYKLFPDEVSKAIENFMDWGDVRELLALHNINAFIKNPSYSLENKIIEIVTKEIIKEEYQMKTGKEINNVTGRLFVSHNHKVKCKNFNLKIIDNLYPNNNYSLTRKIKEYNKLTARARKYVEDPIPFITTKTLKDINLHKLSERQVNFLHPFLSKEDNGKEKMLKFYSTLYSSFPLSKLINRLRKKTNDIQRFSINSIFKSNKENFKYLTKKYYKFDKVYMDKSKKTIKDIDAIYEATISLHLNKKPIIDIDFFGTELNELVECLEMHIDDTNQNIPKDALLITNELNQIHPQENHVIVQVPRNNEVSPYQKFKSLLDKNELNKNLNFDNKQNTCVFYSVLSIILLLFVFLFIYL